MKSTLSNMSVSFLRRRRRRLHSHTANQGILAKPRGQGILAKRTDSPLRPLDTRTREQAL